MRELSLVFIKIIFFLLHQNDDQLWPININICLITVYRKIWIPSIHFAYFSHFCYKERHAHFYSKICIQNKLKFQFWMSMKRKIGIWQIFFSQVIRLWISISIFNSVVLHVKDSIVMSRYEKKFKMRKQGLNEMMVNRSKLIRGCRG